MKNNYEIVGEEVVIHMNNTKETMDGPTKCVVSISKLDKLLSLPVRWYSYKTKNTRYVKCNHKGESIILHRFLTDAPKGMVVDHQDGHGLNNLDSNLRVMTNSENAQHRTRSKRGRARGVRQIPSGRWEASVQTKGKYHHIGTFDTEEEAIENAIIARKNILPSHTC